MILRIVDDARDVTSAARALSASGGHPGTPCVALLAQSLQELSLAAHDELDQLFLVVMAVALLTITRAQTAPSPAPTPQTTPTVAKPTVAG